MGPELGQKIEMDGFDLMAQNPQNNLLLTRQLNTPTRHARLRSGIQENQALTVIAGITFSMVFSCQVNNLRPKLQLCN